MNKKLKTTLLGLLSLTLIFGLIWGISVLNAPKQTQAAPTGADNSAASDQVTAAGIGKVSVEPDIAYLTLGYECKDKDAAKAASDNAAKMEAILKVVKAEGIKEEDIKTTSYDIYPMYNYYGDKRNFEGYQITHYVQITVKDLKKTATILDKSVQAGANLVSNIQFDVADRGKAYQSALDAAVKDAKLKAETMTKAADITGALKLTQVVEVSYTAEPIYARNMKDMAVAEDAEYSVPTPISAGTLDVTANVTATFTWGP